MLAYSGCSEQATTDRESEAGAPAEPIRLFGMMQSGRAIILSARARAPARRAQGDDGAEAAAAGGSRRRSNDLSGGGRRVFSSFVWAAGTPGPRSR
jgi:hypothetical protein